MSCTIHNIAVIMMHHDAKMCVSLLVRVTMTLKSDTFSLRAVQQGRSDYKHKQSYFFCLRQTYKYKGVVKFTINQSLLRMTHFL